MKAGERLQSTNDYDIGLGIPAKVEA